MSQQQPKRDLTGTDVLQRPPYTALHALTTKPLIVTPTLVSRVDSTAWDERPHDDGSSVDRKGKEVRKPNKHADDLALEPNANLAFAHWDEYWRKVHGPKFAYEEQGATSQRVLRYDQLHRLPSGPSSFFRPPYRAMVESSGKLVSDPHARVPLYARPRWDGLAYIAYENKEDIRKTLVEQEQYAKRIIADEHVAFRVVTREICQEYIFIPSARHRDAFSLVQVHKRRPELSREEFQRRMLREHAPLLMAKSATHTYVRRYVQLHNIGSTQSDPEGSTIDALSVLAFASLNDVEDFLSSADYDSIEAHEMQVAGEGSEFWTAANYSVINRLLPELATELE